MPLIIFTILIFNYNFATHISLSIIYFSISLFGFSLPLSHILYQSFNTKKPLYGKVNKISGKIQKVIKEYGNLIKHVEVIKSKTFLPDQKLITDKMESLNKDITKEISNFTTQLKELDEYKNKIKNLEGNSMHLSKMMKPLDSENISNKDADVEVALTGDLTRLETTVFRIALININSFLNSLNSLNSKLDGHLKDKKNKFETDFNKYRSSKKANEISSKDNKSVLDYYKRINDHLLSNENRNKLALTKQNRTVDDISKLFESITKTIDLFNSPLPDINLFTGNVSGAGL